MNACKKCGRMTTRKELFSSFYDHCDFCDAPKKKADAVGDLVMGDGVISLPPGMKFDHSVFDSHGSSANKVKGWSTRKDTLVLNGTHELMSVAPGARGFWSDHIDSGDVLQINTHSWTCLVSGFHEFEFDGSVLTITRTSDGTRWHMDPNKGLIAGSMVGRLSHSAPQMQTIPVNHVVAVGSGPCHVDQSTPNTTVHYIGSKPGGMCSCGMVSGSVTSSKGVSPIPGASLKSLSDAVDDAKKKLDQLKTTKVSNKIVTFPQTYQHGVHWREGDRCLISVTHVGSIKDIIPPGLEMEGGLKLEVLGIHDEPTLFSFKVKGWVEFV